MGFQITFTGTEYDGDGVLDEVWRPVMYKEWLDVMKKSMIQRMTLQIRMVLERCKL